MKHDPFFIIEVNDKNGYIDVTGHVVIEPQFDDASHFFEGIANVMVGRERGYINTSGNFIIPPRFIDKIGLHNTPTWDFSEGLAAVEIDGKWGFIDQRGEFTIKPQFDDIAVEGFREGLAAACITSSQKNITSRAVRIKIEGYAFANHGHSDVEENIRSSNEEKWGFIDKSGRFIIQPIYEDIYIGFRDGWAAVKMNGKWGFIDKTGAFVIKPQFTFGGGETNPCKFCRQPIALFSDGLMPVEIDGKWGYIDRTGALAIAPHYDDAGSFNEGLASVARHDDAKSSNEGLVSVSIGDQWSYIDTSGRQVIELPGGCIGESFSEGLAVIRTNDKCGYIDRIGQVVIQPQFSTAGAFSYGLAAVSIDEDDERTYYSGYIDRTGKYIWGPVKNTL